MNVSADNLPLGDLPDGSVPLAAVTSLKVMLEDGQVSYQLRISDGLSLVEALGMARHAVLVIEDAILHPSR